jgi:hypothetical protein
MSINIVQYVFTQPNNDDTALLQGTGTALTGSYVRVGSAMKADGSTSGFLHIYYTKGDETSIEVQARYTLRTGSTEAKSTVITSSGATSVISASEFQYAGSSDNIIIPFGVEGREITFYIKATGGTPTGTYGAGICLRRE